MPVICPLQELATCLVNVGTVDHPPIGLGLESTSLNVAGTAGFEGSPKFSELGNEYFVEYLLLLQGWYAGLRPPTVCAKSSKAYNVYTLRQD
jgi:hypothetical protein